VSEVTLPSDRTKSEAQRLKAEALSTKVLSRSTSSSIPSDYVFVALVTDSAS
jgi:hypothetical protein